MEEVVNQYSPEEREEVNIFLRTYLGCARAGLVDDRWSAAQKLYGSIILTEMFRLAGSPEMKG